MKNEPIGIATGADKDALIEWLTNSRLGSVVKRSTQVAIAPYSETDGSLQWHHDIGSGDFTSRASPPRAVRCVAAEQPEPERRRLVRREIVDQDRHATARERCPEPPGTPPRSEPPWRRRNHASGQSQTLAGNNSRRRGSPVLCAPRSIIGQLSPALAVRAALAFSRRPSAVVLAARTSTN